MAVGAQHVERIAACEAKYDPILIVHSHRVRPSQISAERVQTVSGRYFQVVNARYGVKLIEFATYDRPQLTRHAPSRFAVDAVPDVPRRLVRERPDHRTPS